MNKNIQKAGAKPQPSLGSIKEGFARVIFTLTACISILAVILICVFLFSNGIPGMAKIGTWDFISGEKWKPGQEVYGILPFILGSVYVTAGALVVGVPAGLMTALFLSRFASKDLVLSAEKEGECVFLNLRGKMDHKAKNVEEALGAPSKWMALLSKIAGASGFSLFASVVDGKLEARFRFSRFRAVPVSSYSCSEQFVVDKVQRAFKLFTLFP